MNFKKGMLIYLDPKNSTPASLAYYDKYYRICRESGNDAYVLETLDGVETAYHFDSDELVRVYERNCRRYKAGDRVQVSCGELVYSQGTVVNAESVNEKLYVPVVLDGFDYSDCGNGRQFHLLDFIENFDEEKKHQDITMPLLRELNSLVSDFRYYVHGDKS